MGAEQQRPLTDSVDMSLLEFGIIQKTFTEGGQDNGIIVYLNKICMGGTCFDPPLAAFFPLLGDFDAKSDELRAVLDNLPTILVLPDNSVLTIEWDETPEVRRFNDEKDGSARTAVRIKGEFKDADENSLFRALQKKWEKLTK